MLKPVIDGVREHFAAMGEADAVDAAVYLADAGYNSERGLEALTTDSIDGYIADGQMRKRDPRYADVRVHKPASKAKTFQPKDFTFDRDHDTCVCPAGKTLNLTSANAVIGGRKATVFKGTAATCEACPLRRQWLRKPDVTAVRQVAFFEGTVASKLPNPHCRAMREKIDSPQGRATDAHRMGLIEPVFGHIQQAACADSRCVVRPRSTRSGSCIASSTTWPNCSSTARWPRRRASARETRVMRPYGRPKSACLR